MRSLPRPYVVGKEKLCVASAKTVNKWSTRVRKSCVIRLLAGLSLQVLRWNREALGFVGRSSDTTLIE